MLGGNRTFRQILLGLLNIKERPGHVARVMNVRNAYRMQTERELYWNCSMEGIKHTSMVIITCQ
jgi:hypothetical protein